MVVCLTWICVVFFWSSYIIVMASLKVQKLWLHRFSLVSELTLCVPLQKILPCTELSGNVYVQWFKCLHWIYYLLKLILKCFVRKKNKDNKMCLFPLTGAVLQAVFYCYNYTKHKIMSYFIYCKAGTEFVWGIKLGTCGVNYTLCEMKCVLVPPRIKLI